MAVAIGSVACAMPWALAVLPYNRLENRGALISFESLTLVRRMLLKTGLTGWLESVVLRYVGRDSDFSIVLTAATVIFLLGGLGPRLLGVWFVIRSAAGRGGALVWTALAWIVIFGVGMPFVIAVAPFPNSIQTYQLGLFALWPFTMLALWPPGARASVLRWAATAVLVAVSVPATLHYVQAAHGATGETPLVEIGVGDMRVIRYLRHTDAKTTMVLHSAPLSPSVYAVEAERRVVLAWSSYVSGDFNPDVDALSARIERFFGSPAAEGSDDPGLLQEYRVTHVIERIAVDRLHPRMQAQLRLVTGTPAVRLYEVPQSLGR
jgi:hypothetical protein